MPTYEYECQSCGHKFEASQSMTEKHIKSCPKCGKMVKRLIGSGSAIIFKGSGFYATDYRKGKESSPKCPAVKPECKGCPKAEKSE